MSLSNIKSAPAALTVVILLMVLLSQSVCRADIRRIEARLKQQRPPLNREYIKTPEGRRHAEEVTDTIQCRLWQNCMLGGGGIPSHHWACSFTDPGISMDVGGYVKKKIVGIHGEHLNGWLESNGAISGSTMLVLSDAEILPDSVVIDTANVISIAHYDDARSNRRLSSTMGVMNTLVVRVVATDNSPPDAQELSEFIFDKEYCLKSQMDRCSHGQLEIQKYVEGSGSEVPTVAPGVIDLVVDEIAEGQDLDYMEAVAFLKLQQVLDVQNFNESFDLVIFCMPPGMGNWQSFAYINSVDSYYNDEDCLELSAQMHEVGHSIGLHHSGEYTGNVLNQEYGDETGYMGYTVDSYGEPAMCYNPAKSWELGWYTNKYYEVNALTEITNDAKSYKLNGVVDYDPESGENIVVKIGNFYVGYNKATSFNAGVMEAANQVTIIENLGHPGLSAFSKLAAKLSVGDSHTFTLDQFYFPNGGEMEISSSVSVTVEYVSISDETDAVIEVKYAEETLECEGGFDAEIDVELIPDAYPGEIAWGIADKNGQYVYFADYGDLNGSVATTVGGLCRGLEYYFFVADEFFDGFCCQFGDGNYKATFEGEELFSGTGLFGDLKTVAFTLPPDTSPECIDDNSTEFLITVDGTEKTKDCAWLASKKKAKRNEYCDQKVLNDSGEQELPTICRETCGKVGKGSCLELTPGPTSSPTASPIAECEDKSKEFLIDVDGEGTIKKKDCEWVAAKKKSKRKQYCKERVEVNGNEKKLPTICKKTCGELGRGECAFLKNA